MRLNSWPQLANTAVGLWLLAAPGILGYGEPAATDHHIVGPVAASLAFVAAWDVTRFLGRTCIVLGIWLVVSPLLLGYDETEAIANGLASGGLMLILAVIGGPITGKFGGGWPELWAKSRN